MGEPVRGLTSVLMDCPRPALSENDRVGVSFRPPMHDCGEPGTDRSLVPLDEDIDEVR